MGANKMGPPECSAKFSPHSGGYKGSFFESDGMPGDKNTDGFTTPGGDKTEGVYNHDKIKGHGNYPHSPADPSFTGPPLGTTVGPQGDVNQ